MSERNRSHKRMSPLERDVRRMERVCELVSKMDATDRRFLKERLNAKEFAYVCENHRHVGPIVNDTCQACGFYSVDWEAVDV